MTDGVTADSLFMCVVLSAPVREAETLASNDWVSPKASSNSSPLGSRYPASKVSALS